MRSPLRAIGVLPANGKHLLAPLRTPLYANSIALSLNSAFTAVLGFAFWVAVARVYQAQDVGLASALLSSVALLAFLSGLGLDQALTRFLPGSKEKASHLLNSTFLVSGLVALAAGGVFLAGVQWWSPSLAAARQHPAYLLAFLGAVPIGAVLGMVNVACVAHRRASLSLLLGVMSSGLRILFALVLVGFFGSFGIFASWVLAIGVAAALGIAVLLPRVYPGYRPRVSLDIRAFKGMVSYSFMNYLTLLFWSAPGYLLPLVVLNRLGSEANAYFFIALAMAGILWSIPLAVSTSLLVEGSHEPEKLHANFARGLVLIGVVLVPAVLFLWLAGDKLLLAFGRAYSVESAQLLRILGIAALPIAVNYLYITVRRVEKRVTGPAVLTGLVALATVVSAHFFVAEQGITGAGWGLLVAQSGGALWALAQLLFGRRERVSIAP